METIKLNITIDKDWLEATWIKEVTTIKDVEKEVEVDGELIKEIVQEESVKTEQAHCESFSGHPEHIAMLEAKALEFGTSLDEYAELIAQAKEAFIMPTEEELLSYENANKVAEAKAYLSSTDFYMTVDKYASLTVERQNELVSKRAEARETINLLQGTNK